MEITLEVFRDLGIGILGVIIIILYSDRGLVSETLKAPLVDEVAIPLSLIGSYWAIGLRCFFLLLIFYWR